MRHGPIRWLYGELPGLVERGVLAPDTAKALREHYGPLPESNARRVLFVVFGVLGALLIGCGIVLLLAHNWEDLSRPLRAALSLGLLLGAQAIALAAARWRPESAAWAEGSAGFLSLAVVACIALISQTYQLGGDLRGLLFAWVLLTLPLTYLLRARVTAVLCWIGATWWLMLVPFWSDRALGDHLIYLAYVALAAPFLVWLQLSHRRESSTALTGWAVCGCLAVAGARLGGWPEVGLQAPFYAGLAGSSYVLGLRLAGDAGPPSAAWRRPFHAAGALGLAVVLIVCSFEEVWGLDWDWGGGGVAPALTGGLTALLCIVSILAGVRRMRKGCWDQALLAWTPLVIATGWVVCIERANATLTMLAVTAYALAVGLALCIRGAGRGRLGTANAGLLLMLVVLAIRFFDANLTFLERGIGFVVLGAAFLGVNLWMLRRREEVRS